MSEYAGKMQEITGRHRVLEATSKAVLSDRNRAYGNPEDNFRNIAEVWNWYFEGKAPNGMLKFTSLDVAHMMVLMKMARLKTNPTHFDSIVDVAGYAACAGDFTTNSALTGG
jgi:Domain of unknown function (DUF6378)